MLCDCVRYVSEKSEKVDDTYVREIYRFDIVRPYEKFFELLRKSPFCRENATRHAGSKILTVTESVSQSQTVNCVRSLSKFLTSAIKRVQEPMKGQGGLISSSALAALVQDSPPWPFIGSCTRLIWLLQVKDGRCHTSTCPELSEPIAPFLLRSIMSMSLSVVT